MPFEKVPPGELIMTPDWPWFNEILQETPPPGWRQSVDSDFSRAFIVDSATGIMRPATDAELDEYIEGGEYDEMVSGQEEWLTLT